VPWHPTLAVSNVLGSRAFQSTLWKRFLESFGLCWLFLEPVGLFKPGQVPKGWTTYLALVAVSGVSALVWAWPKKVVSATIPGADVKVTVRVGDIFDAKDNVVIGTNDVFDTHIGDGIISSRSVQAQFVHKRFGGSVSAVDTIMDDLLKDIGFNLDPTKQKGKNKRFPVGTVLEVEANGIRHYLSAYCRMGSNLKAETDVCTLLRSLEKCWGKIRNSGQNLGVSMPVLGADFGRVGLTQTQLIQILVLSFVDANRIQHVAPELTIYVFEGNAGLVDFSALRLWLRGVLWA
jgi:hypothetical protein